MNKIVLIEDNNKDLKAILNNIVNYYIEKGHIKREVLKNTDIIIKCSISDILSGDYDFELTENGFLIW